LHDFVAGTTVLIKYTMTPCDLSLLLLLLLLLLQRINNYRNKGEPLTKSA
jgi:hypothetical protein